MGWTETIHFAWRTLDLDRARGAARAAAEELGLRLARVGWREVPGARPGDLAIDVEVEIHGRPAAMTLATAAGGATLRIEEARVAPEVLEQAVECFALLAAHLGGALDADRYADVGATAEDAGPTARGPRDAVTIVAYDADDRVVARDQLPRIQMLDPRAWARRALLNDEGRRAVGVARMVSLYHDEDGRPYQRIVEAFDARGRRTERLSEAV